MAAFIPELFQRLTTGVYVIGVGKGDRRNAFTAAWVMQVSYDPLLVALSINAKHSSYTLLNEHRAFSVNILSKGENEIAAQFGQPASAGKMKVAEWTMGRTGLPLLRGAIGWLACEGASETPAGDHRLVVGRVIGGELVDRESEPMLYRETDAMDNSAALFPKTF